MKFIKLLGLAVLISSSLACQEEEKMPLENPVQKKLGENLWPEAVNENNPYESHYFGIYHNYSLNYFRDKRPEYNSDIAWANDAAGITLEYFCGGDDLRYCDGSLTPSMLSAITDTAVSSQLFNQCISKLPISVQNYIHTCLGFFEDYTTSEYHLLKADIVNLESQIAMDNDISENHRKLLLSATQIARYTGFYWKEEISEDFKKWHVIINADETDYAAITREDIKGCLVGYLQGSDDASRVTMAANVSPHSSTLRVLSFMN